MTGTLADSLALTAEGEGAYRAFADPGNEAGTGMFGGWTAAMLLKAVVNHPQATGTPSALNVTYISRIPPGRDLVFTARRLSGGPSVSTWLAEVRLADKTEASAMATVVLTNRRESLAFTEFAMPKPEYEPEALPMLHPPNTFGQRIDMRSWTMPLNQPTTHSLQWLRERSNHPIDHVLLAYFADSYAPRIFYKSEAFRPSSTLTMSVYFYATADELAAIGDDFFLSEAVGTRAEQATVGAQLRLWSRAGALLATSEQLCWFK